MEQLIRGFYGNLICPRLLNNAVKLCYNCWSGFYNTELLAGGFYFKNADTLGS